MTRYKERESERKKASSVYAIDIHKKKKTKKMSENDKEENKEKNICLFVSFYKSIQQFCLSRVL